MTHNIINYNINTIIIIIVKSVNIIFKFAVRQNSKIKFHNKFEWTKVKSILRLFFKFGILHVIYAHAFFVLYCFFDLWPPNDKQCPKTAKTKKPKYYLRRRNKSSEKPANFFYLSHAKWRLYKKKIPVMTNKS